MPVSPGLSGAAYLEYHFNCRRCARDRKPFRMFHVKQINIRK